MDSATIDGLTFREFHKEFSRMDPRTYRGKRSMFYAATNEIDFQSAAEVVRQENAGMPLYFMGVIGGVDMALNYIANLDPERAFLFDISEEAVAYLGLRLCICENSSDIHEYVRESLCISEDATCYIDYAHSKEDFLRRISASDTVYDIFLRKAIEFRRRLGFSEDDDFGKKVFMDVEFRRSAAKKALEYDLESKMRMDQDYWCGISNRKKIAELSSKNRIRGFNAMIIPHADSAEYRESCFENAALELVQAYGIKNLIVYLSDVTTNLVVGNKPGEAEEARMSRRRDLFSANFSRLDTAVDKLWFIENSNDGRNSVFVIGGKSFS